jgi:peptidoglycan/LPS O-acetylase OafA/YrhL
MATKRLSEIDGLRGIAALSVMCGHWGEAIKKQGAPLEWSHALQSIFLDYFSFGRLGIVAFFCVSGFVVPFSFRGPHPMIAFPLSRMFRLYPAYWASIALAIVIFPFIGVTHLTMLQILANLTMVSFALHQPSVLGVYWTLFIELVFYAICYAMFGLKHLYSPRANFGMMCLFLSIALSGGVYRWINPISDFPIGIPTYLAAMHFGTLARLRTLEQNRTAATLYPIALLLLVVGVTAANTLAYFYAKNELVGWVAADIAYLVGLSLFLLCIHFKWFVGRVRAYLGRVSYSMYLFHMIMIDVFVFSWKFMPNWYLAVIIYTPLYFATTILIANFVYLYVERPAISWGRRLDAAIDTAMGSRSRSRSEKI